MPTIAISKERCKGCERCIDACPQNILEMSRELNTKGYFTASLAQAPRCIGCRMCAIACPDCAIDVLVEGAFYELFTY